MRETHHSFAARLQTLRHAKRLSKSEVAKRVGVSPTCVWNWEEGNTEPRPENLTALSAVFSVTPDYLQYGRTDENSLELSDQSLPKEASDTLSEVILKSKEAIARASGLPTNKVIITLEY